ncbi:MAG: TlpA family protein disulfide reductase [Planctomycetaceae bacterium]
MTTRALIGAILCLAAIGCGSDSDKEGADQQTVNPSPSPGRSIANSVGSANHSVTKTPSPEPAEASDDLTDALFGNGPPPAGATAADREPQKLPESGLNLRADLTPQRLSEFLKLADLEMQRIANQVNTGKMPQRAGDEEMQRLGKLKLQAAVQLQAAENADARQKVLGIRGQLQSLSHLAALGDLPSAKQLEALAKQHVDHEDASVSQDSRLVLIGLALEKIQNGSEKNPSEVMSQVSQIGRDGRTPDIATMMVLGQARVVLEQYGFTEQAGIVRDQIVDLFSSHSDPAVAAMALEVAGTPRFAEVDRMLRRLEGEQQDNPLTADVWRSTIEQLLSETPDLSAVQFIAGAALQAEASGRDDLVDATYDALQSAKTLGEREQQEVQRASAARDARRSMIGQSIELDLPSADGRPLTMSSYLGKVVLMPFWSIQYPQSLSLMQRLDEIRKQSAGQVEIVGVNLDTADAPFDEFMASSPVRFRSFHSETKPEAEITNAAAKKFGVVSMPFVVIVDREGKVAAVDFAGQRLQETVAKLIASPAGT